MTETRRTIITIDHGSTLYGTRTPTSDTDTVTIELPTSRELLLGTARGTTRIGTRPEGQQRNGPDDSDENHITLTRFLEHLVTGRPQTVDTLFAPTWAVHDVNLDVWVELLRNRGRILTRQSTGMLDYVKRRIGRFGGRGSEYWRRKKVMDLGETFGPDALVASVANLFVGDKALGCWSSDTYIKTDDGRERVEFLHVHGKKIPYYTPMSEVRPFLRQKFESHEGRIGPTGDEHKDSGERKILVHAVRTALQAEELFTTGRITFPRPEAKLLLSIRSGEVPWVRACEWLAAGYERAQEAFAKADLPAEPDQDWIDEFVYQQHKSVVVDAEMVA